jgi:hypothetical protein
VKGDLLVVIHYRVFANPVQRGHGSMVFPSNDLFACTQMEKLDQRRSASAAVLGRDVLADVLAVLPKGRIGEHV